VTVLLELADVTKHYGDVAGDAPPVLRGVDLQLVPGESLAIVGPSGSGKSTLLNLLGGLDHPTSGRVTLEGADLAAMKADELARLRNRRIGFVFQLHHLLPQCTALENVLVPTLVDTSAEERRGRAERARLLLTQVGLGERLSHRPGQLSGGECQRVAVVRALINEPTLLLADEPTGSLDGGSAQQLGDLLAQLNDEHGVTLVVVTHSMELARRMGRVLELRDGRLVEPDAGP
jgi:predicted ABC-type transport system involved in lysophospholipase L1 biosynthesis ATPase subunit